MFCSSMPQNRMSTLVLLNLLEPTNRFNRRSRSFAGFGHIPQGMKQSHGGAQPPGKENVARQTVRQPSLIDSQTLDRQSLCRLKPGFLSPKEETGFKVWWNLGACGPKIPILRFRDLGRCPICCYAAVDWAVQNGNRAKAFGASTPPAASPPSLPAACPGIGLIRADIEHAAFLSVVTRPPMQWSSNSVCSSQTYQAVSQRYLIVIDGAFHTGSALAFRPLS